MLITEAGINAIPQSGVYVLLIRAGASRVAVGAWGELRTHDGFYAYVGRAKRGLRARLERHFGSSPGKRLRWHVDYLLEVAEAVEAWIFPFEQGECEAALMLEEAGASREGLERFGASDCRCRGHLLYLGGTKPPCPFGAVAVFRS